MKRSIRFSLLALCLCLLLPLLAGCSGNASSDTSTDDIPFDVEIKEKLFLTQMNDIFANKEDYMGKTIKYEGMFFSAYYEPADSNFNVVIRYGPGCCVGDGTVGLEVRWEDDSIQTPEADDWVEVIGVLEEYEELGATYLRLNLSSLKVLDKRGAETVAQ